MTEINIETKRNSLVEVNEETLEPNEYFKLVKGCVQNINEAELQNQLNLIAQQILAANDIGQKSLVDKLSYTYDTITKEQAIVQKGFDKFVYMEDVEKYLDLTRHIKMIELDRFPRTIPLENLERIKEAKGLEIFDDFMVIFTDLTNNVQSTEEEMKFVDRNKDPVVFGYFRHEEAGINHSRFYFITDWEDEYCDLTFTKMIVDMTERGIERPEYKISTDHSYIQEIVASTLDDMKNKNPLGDHRFSNNFPKENNKNVFTRLKSWILGK